MQKAIDENCFYTAAQVEEMGLWREPTLRAYRHETRRTGRLIGPLWVEIGRRRVYRGADLLAALSGPGARAAGGR